MASKSSAESSTDSSTKRAGVTLIEPLNSEDVVDHEYSRKFVDPPQSSKQLYFDLFRPTSYYSQFHHRRIDAEAYKLELAKEIRAAFIEFTNPTNPTPKTPYNAFGLYPRFRIVSMAPKTRTEYRDLLWKCHHAKNSIDPRLFVLVKDTIDNRLFLAYPKQTPILFREAKKPNIQVLNYPVYEKKTDLPYGYHGNNALHGIYTFQVVTPKAALYTIANIAMNDRSMWPKVFQKNIGKLFISGLVDRYKSALSDPANFDFSSYVVPFGECFLPLILPTKPASYYDALRVVAQVILPEFHMFNAEFAERACPSSNIPELPVQTTPPPAPKKSRTSKKTPSVIDDGEHDLSGITGLSDEMLLPDFTETDKYSSIVSSCISRIADLGTQRTLSPAYVLSEDRPDLSTLKLFFQRVFSGASLEHFLDDWNSKLVVKVPDADTVASTELKKNANVTISKMRTLLLKTAGISDVENIKCPAFIYSILANLFSDQIDEEAFKTFYQTSITSFANNFETSFGLAVLSPISPSTIQTNLSFRRDYEVMIKYSMLTAHTLLEVFSKWFREYEEKIRQHNTSLFTTLSELIEQVEEMKNCVVECGAQNTRLSQKTQNLRTEISGLKTELTAVTSQNDALKEALSEKDKQIKALEAQLAERQTLTSSSSSSYPSMPSLPKPTPLVENPQSKLISSMPASASTRLHNNIFKKRAKPEPEKSDDNEESDEDPIFSSCEDDDEEEEEEDEDDLGRDRLEKSKNLKKPKTDGGDYTNFEEDENDDQDENEDDDEEDEIIV
jgi:hypothetical protein